MLIISVALWTIAFILIATNPKSEPTRWVSGVAFFSGAGPLGVFLNETFTPALTTVDTVGYVVLRYTASILLSSGHFIAPYVFLVFAVINSKLILTNSKKSWFKGISLLPVILMYIIFPLSTSFEPIHWILTVWVTPYVLAANVILIYSYFKTDISKIQKQKLLNIIILTPTTLFSLTTNYILPTFHIDEAWRYMLWIIILQFFAFLAFAAKYGVFGVKLRFVRYQYAALKNVIDNISEGFFSIDEQHNIAEFNKAFVDQFGEIKKGQKLIHLLDKNKRFESLKDIVLKRIEEVINTQRAIKFEHYFEDGFPAEKYYTIEITPVILEQKHIATVILFNDITEHKKVLALMEVNQNQLIDNERLLSLNQLIGGIAHNLTKPLLASSGGIEILAGLTRRWNEIINDMDIDPDNKKAYRDMNHERIVWEDRIREYLAYMSEVITAVKGQAALTSNTQDSSFTVNELINRVKILMTHELKKASCKINFNSSLNSDLQVMGDINCLTQVLDNLISNAIEAYENNEGGNIDIIFKQNNLKNIDIMVKDYGKGIKDEIKNKLFKQMVTTKGKKGTGLGLFISKAIITSKFNGEIRLESDLDRGSTFIITIPIGGERNEQ